MRDVPVSPPSAPAAAIAAADAVIGSSPRMRAVIDFVRVIRDSESNVLITGETGTGKETIARLLHQMSPRRGRPFVAVSCAILTETLIESELFGHDRGAFTGAFKDRPGRFELADTGTIFLDDIDDVPSSVQIKLLRVVQQRVVDRVGGIRPIPVDVRVVTGSKRNLRQLIAEGTFRADLYFRLNVLPVWLPPLRERREDIPLLTDHFIRRFFAARGASVPELSATVRKAFLDYSWPGNVRELENACERIAETCHCPRVRFACMPASILFNVQKGHEDLPVVPVAQSLDGRLQQVETQLITTALEASHGNKSRAAELLGIKRSTLSDRIRRLMLDPIHHR
jgi:transcriptional regulator with GAF, ATPase, and Fis domain